ncbi:UbiA family prenyltransferase [Lutibacter citreus]|uniref:UbiA family prenyltransferase n=1 Tax=Lutibacter citreus TaxID=2138210 RepID=UPI000DBE15EC
MIFNRVSVQKIIIKNVILVAYTFFLIRFQLFNYYSIETNLSYIQFYQLLISVLFITTGGYLINDINNNKIDKINKPKEQTVSNLVSLEKAKRWYLYINSIGLILGIQLCLTISKPSLSILFIGASLLLYYYSKKFKGIPFLGNFIISILLSLSLSLLVFFDINYSNNNINNQTVTFIISILIVFVFFLNLIREIIKDIENINKDNQLNLNTLPLVFGRNRIKYLASYLCFPPIFMTLIFVWNYSEINLYFSLFLLIFIGIPLIYVSLKLRLINSQKKFHKLNTILKVIIFLAISSIYLFIKTQ